MSQYDHKSIASQVVEQQDIVIKKSTEFYNFFRESKAKTRHGFIHFKNATMNEVFKQEFRFHNEGRLGGFGNFAWQKGMTMPNELSLKVKLVTRDFVSIYSYLL